MLKNIWVLAILEAITLFLILFLIKNVSNNSLDLSLIIVISLGVPILHLFFNWRSETKINVPK